MQKPRRWRRLQFHLLPLTTAACASFSAPSPSASPSPAIAVSEAKAPAASPPVAATPPPGTSRPPGSLAAEAASAATPELELPKGTKVLQVGDSFADALGIEL